MKRISFLALGSALLLASCNQTSLPQTTVVDPTTSGLITFTLKPATPEKGLNGQALPTPTNVRVLVTNADTGFKLIKDVAVGAGASTVQARVPARGGYKLEAFSYLTKSVYDKRILKDGSIVNINVVQGQTTNVNLSLQALSMQLSAPASVVSGEQFKVAITNKPALIFNDIVYLRLSKTAFVQDSDFNISTAPYTVGNEITVNALSSDSSGTLYIQTRSFLAERFVESGESYVSFNYYSPSVDFGDALKTTDMVLPAGDISVGITY